MAGYKQAFRKAFPYTIPGIDRIFIYWNCIWSYVCGKRIFIFVGNADEPDGLCRVRAVFGSEFFCAGSFFSKCDCYDTDGEYPTYFLWDFSVGAVPSDGKKALVYDLWADR